MKHAIDPERTIVHDYDRLGDFYSVWCICGKQIASRVPHWAMTPDNPDWRDTVEGRMEKHIDESPVLEQFRDPELETSGKIVGFYEREFYVFSNFSSFQVQWRGRLWPTSEHAYQAAHFFETAPELVEDIFAARSAHQAFKIAKANADKAPADWDQRKPELMREICRAKLLQHEYVQIKLMQTEDLLLVEDSPKDDYWGWGKDRTGRNELGKIWMELRQWWRSDRQP